MSICTTFECALRSGADRHCDIRFAHVPTGFGSSSGGLHTRSLADVSGSHGGAATRVGGRKKKKMSAMFKNLQYALRLLRKSPGFTAVAIVTLALGIGATTAIYSVLYATLLAPMPYPDPNQLVMVWSKPGEGRNSVSAGDFLDWRAQNTVFQDLNAWTGAAFNLATAEHPEQINGQLTTPGFYTMMGVRFELGRDSLPEQGHPGKHHIATPVPTLRPPLPANR